MYNPTARRVFPYVGGMHLWQIPGPGAFVLHLHDQPPQPLRLLEPPYDPCDS
jgi:hypothetical protein